uniref:NepR family anti-sigma factor n=1 Tax=Edaphosphingomonas laterariae TaxID=861865 RepID=UPI001181B625|nr:NepR family anti-sigma factor [Sphingomonas laterariae]
MGAKETKGKVVNNDRDRRPPTKSRRGNDTHLGQALRSAWDEALREDVPADMLDLLGKLD